MYDCLPHLSMCITRVPHVHKRPENHGRFAGPRVIGGCEPSRGYWEQKPSHLKSSNGS